MSLFFPCNSLIASFRNLAPDAMKGQGSGPFLVKAFFALQRDHRLPLKVGGGSHCSPEGCSSQVAQD